MRLRLGRLGCVLVLATSAVGAIGAKDPDGSTLKVVLKKEVVGPDMSALAREPMIVESARGTLFLAGYGSKEPNDTPRLWKSEDHGATWSRVKVGTAAEGAIGNSDVDLAIGPEGTLYFVSMGFDWPPAGEGTHITVGVSRDEGKSWKWSVLSRVRKVDRPWVAAGPDGKAYVIWNDGKSVFCARSTDDGANWTTGTVTDGGGGSSHLVVGPKGEIAVRLTPVSQSGSGFTAGVDLIAMSTDGGKSWQKNAAPGERDWVSMEKMGPTDTPRWVEPLAFDKQGRLYSLWTNKKAVWLARSADLGKTWSTWKLRECEEMCFYPYLAVSAEEAGASWMTGDEKGMSFHVVRVGLSEKGPTTVEEAEPQPLDTWERNEKPNEPPQAEGAGEYDAVLFLRNGNLGVVTPVQDGRKKRYGFALYEFGSSQPKK